MKEAYPESYKNHKVFEEIEYMIEIYGNISFACFPFVPLGTSSIMNYVTYTYTAIQGTLESIKTLLEIGRISDAYTLARKYFDDVLVDLYIDVIRKDRYDFVSFEYVDDVEKWLKSKHRIPSIKKILQTLKNSESTKDLYPYFGWDTYFHHNRIILDDCVHSNRYSLMILNCGDVYLHNREKHLQNILIILKSIITMHLAFIFYMNPQYLMASDYIDYLDEGATPPEGSDSWIATYAQKAFDRYIKSNDKLAAFIKDNCSLSIE